MKRTMQSSRLVSVIALAAAMSAPMGATALAAEGEAGAAHADAAATFDQFELAEDKFEFLNTYCVECHNFEEWAGGVAFDTMDPALVADEAETWEKVLLKLRGGLMPPPGENHPPEAEISDFVGWMEAYLDHAGSLELQPGSVPLHRLNRKEYANAVRDLLAVDLDPSSLLPEDGVADGFDNVAEALQVSPSFLDQYLTAAHTIAVRAVGNPESRPGSEYYLPGPMDSVQQTEHVPGLPLGTRGGLVRDHYFPADGTYYVNVSDIAGGVYFLNTELEHTLIVTLDGVKVYETTIGGDEDGKAIDQIQAPAVEAINLRLRDIPVQATAGTHRIGATFVQRSFAETEGQLDEVTLGSGDNHLPRVLSLEVRGPYNPTGLSQTASREAIFTCYPEAPTEEAACAEEILTGLAHRAYRRPLTETDTAELMEFYQRGHEADGFEEGVRTGISRILASPHFLYRETPVPDGVQPGEPFALTDLQLASRLSFFLWSSIPDQELLSIAEEGRLTNERVLREQVQRMLADPKAESLSRNFAYQWLHLSKLADVVPEATIFPAVAEHRDVVAYKNDFRADMQEELLLWADSIMRGDASVLDFIEGDTTYLNERLALLYGIHDVKGADFRPVTLEDPTRWGLMGKAGVLTLTSYPNRTAPVLRGAYVLETILGAPPAAPPPGVEALPENKVGEQAMTVRERMVAHRADPSCNSCHGIMDPLGMALENFDGVGMWRDNDRFAGAPIDSVGALPDGTPITGPEDMRAALMRQKDMFVENLTKRLMLFALGRETEYHDMPTVRAIAEAAAEDDYRFVSIVEGIVNSDQFRMSTAPEQVAEEEQADRVEEAALR